MNLGTWKGIWILLYFTSIVNFCSSDVPESKEMFGFKFRFHKVRYMTNIHSTATRYTPFYIILNSPWYNSKVKTEHHALVKKTMKIKWVFKSCHVSSISSLSVKVSLERLLWWNLLPAKTSGLWNQWNYKKQSPKRYVLKWSYTSDEVKPLFRSSPVSQALVIAFKGISNNSEKLNEKRKRGH